MRGSFETAYAPGPAQAVWYDGKSAAARPVALFYRPQTREIRVCEPNRPTDVYALEAWDVRGMRLLSGNLDKLGAGELRFAPEPDTGARLVIRDEAAKEIVAAWLRGPVEKRRRTLLRRWVLAAASAWILCVGLYFASPVIFSGIARIIPHSWEESLGESARENVLRVLKYTPGVRGRDEAATDSPDLAGLLTRLEEGAPVDGYTFDLLVLDADFINAFALPGGYMVVSTGLIRHCSSPDELAGVLAHEMAHVTQRHGTGNMLRHYAWSTFIRMLGGNDSMAGNMAMTVLSSSFSRDDEREADALGAARLAGAGIDPMGLAEFFAGLSKDDNEAVYRYISSHPSSTERQENIRKTVESGQHQDVPYTPAMSAEAWQRFRILCEPGK